MIDKKPFRVDNETVKNWATTTYDVPEGASIQDICFSAAFIAANEMAADLIDARELVDKQEALIKKQSILLQSVEKDLNWMLNEGKLLAPHAFKYFYDGIKELEKTKDYA